MNKFLFWIKTTLLIVCFYNNAYADTGKKFFDFNLHGATGGILRFPNSVQSQDDDNFLGNMWIKEVADFKKMGKITFSAYALATITADTYPYPYNNISNISAGLDSRTMIGKHLNVNLSVQLEKERELRSKIEKTRLKYRLGYYYYRQWKERTKYKYTGSFHTATPVLKMYGSLSTPGSFDADDNNIVAFAGGQYAFAFKSKDHKFLLVPFADFAVNWDKDSNDYNNTLIFSAGMKVRHPIKMGEIFWGAKAQVDRRWVVSSLKTGGMIFLGWYKGW